MQFISMKKKLFFIIVTAIAVSITFTACNSKGSQSSSDSGTEENAQSYDLDLLKKQYTQQRIDAALKRNIAVQNTVRPSDASTFGAKKAEVKWRAFEEDLSIDNLIREVGIVTVVHYEKGVEIIKDGTSWYYDGINYEKSNLMHVSAALAILDQPRWEPTYVQFSGTSLYCKFIYPEGHDEEESFFLFAFVLRSVDVNGIGDMLSYPDAIKEY